jgi:hypothetical protein
VVIGKKGASAPFFLPVADSLNGFAASPRRNTMLRRTGLAHRSLEPNAASTQWNDNNHITSGARHFRRRRAPKENGVAIFQGRLRGSYGPPIRLKGDAVKPERRR